MYYVLERDRIDSMFQPVIQMVRDNKINSFVQLRNFQSRSSQNNSYIFQPQPHPHPKPPQKPNKTHTGNFLTKPPQKQFMLSPPKTARSKHEPNPEQFNNFIPFSLNKKQYKNATISSRSTGETRDRDRDRRDSWEERRKKMVRVGSKVKKHLIQRIDFQDIEKCLYHKRDCLTRYQYFMEIKSKQKELNTINNQNHRLLFKNKTYHQPKQDPKNHSIQDLQLHLQKQQQSPLRTTPRKKFWMKQAKRAGNTGIFENASAFIEGKAYRTIDT